MKEIKFRAKIKENGKPKMFYQEDQYLVSFLRRVTMFLAFQHDDKDTDSFNGGRHESYLEDHALEKCLEQYTGLRDKNDREIYEGDIVKYDFEPCGEQTGEFVFSEGYYFIKGTNRWRPIECEVIGNVYENPELLK